LKKPIIGATVVIVLLVILFIPMIPVTIKVKEPYETTKMVEESYERKVKYSVDKAYLEDRYELVRGRVTVFNVVVRNVDTGGGTFKVSFHLYDVKGLFGTAEKTAFIGPGQTVTFSSEFDTAVGQDVRGEYEVTPPSMIDKRLVEKKVIEERLVEKTKMVSLFDLITGRA